MRQLKFLFLAVLALGADAQEFRDTAVPNSQIQAIVRDVAQWHDMQHPDCAFVKAVGSNLIERHADSTVEHWSIEACAGRTFTYRVLVMPQPDGGVSDSVSNVDGSPTDSREPISPEELAADCTAWREELVQMGAIDDVPDSKIVRYAQLSADVAACRADGPTP